MTSPISSKWSTGVHLTKRFVGMMSRRPVEDGDLVWVEAVLLDGESSLWHELPVADQRHSVAVARRFIAQRAGGFDDGGDAPRDDVAAALLHDIGKLGSGLGIWSRVLATVVGPRTARFRLYHDHERIGAEMLRSAGCSPRTVALVAGTSSDSRALEALRRADDV